MTAEPTISRRKTSRCSLLTLLLLMLHGTAVAWVYPEHRAIAMLAIQQLSTEDQELLQRIWNEARTGHEDRLTVGVIDPDQGREPTALDYAAWSGIAGDHSCSPSALMDVVLRSDWILRVADITARLRIELANARDISQRNNAIRDSDIRLQRADQDYATRAGSNNVHFLLARSGADQMAPDYFSSCLREGAPLNALGMYAWYHRHALMKFALVTRERLSGPDRSDLLLAALADEAFALHFLQDVFASGHVAGTWGATAQRKGTHDHYNEAGLEVVLWNGERLVLAGDAYMRDTDARIAARPVALSLQQLLAALRQGTGGSPTERGPDPFDVCLNNDQPAAAYDQALWEPVFLLTPMPGLPEGFGELPRFRAELGPFFGMAAALDASTVNGGFGQGQSTPGAVGGLEANAMFGLGMDGVLNRSGDGLVFLQVGWRQDAASTQSFGDVAPSLANSSITAAIPGRSGYNLRLRLPFWLIPGDLIVAAPVLGLASPGTLQRMAVTAANGGVIPWQSGISTPVGRFQFILGREVGVSFYGIGNTSDALLVPAATGPSPVVVTYRSTKWDFPVVEYRPTRSFSSTQTASLKVQLGFGVDNPHHVEATLPTNDPPVELKSVWYAGLRIFFDWRHYL